MSKPSGWRKGEAAGLDSAKLGLARYCSWIVLDQRSNCTSYEGLFGIDCSAFF